MLRLGYNIVNMINMRLRQCRWIFVENPSINRVLCLCNGFFIRSAMRPATWKLRHSDNINLIEWFPLNDHRIVKIFSFHYGAPFTAAIASRTSYD